MDEDMIRTRETAPEDALMEAGELGSPDETAALEEPVAEITSGDAEPAMTPDAVGDNPARQTV